MEKKKIRVGITHGDINGVGYEIILKAFAEPTLCDLCIPILYGSPKTATYHRKALDLQTNFTIVDTAATAECGRLNMVACQEEESKIDFGQSTEEGGQSALISLERAIQDYKEGLIDVLVTAPINKKNIQCADFKFLGHTEYLENRIGEGAEPLMILMNEVMRVALVTTHLPIKDIAQAITTEKIIKKIKQLNTSLHQDFRISIPRIAVLALNPHASDGGLIGTEESEIIEPAIKECVSKGIKCFGTYSADGFFGAGEYEHFDAVLAMYHDQGLAPFKALSMGGGVNYTAGLPLVRTSPDHGTAYNIAGKGQADENSLRQAIYAAIDIYRNRISEAKAHIDPLGKLYHEYRDDSDRLKLN
ncbi:MAG: 4-hydroxythreonine-4-phosphate dehydrogenase PdxA [Bacteroidaceae bacterium]